MELRIPYKQIGNAQTITPIMTRLLADRLGDANAIHRYEVVKMEDDDDRQVRVVTVKPKTYVVMG
jgi:hypothetical protein